MKRSNGEGTIYKRKDGRWCGAYYDEGLTPKRHFVYGKTQTEVKKKLKEKKQHVEQAQKDLVVPECLGKWVLYYLENYKKNEIKETTYDNYIRYYRKHIRDSDISKIKLSQITSNILQRYYNMKLAEGYNVKTVKQVQVIINAALSHAEKMHLVMENVNRLTTLPKKQVYNASILSVDEVKTILTETRDEDLYPIIVLVLFTGLRKGEVMALKWSKIDFEKRELYIESSLCRVETDEMKNGHHIYTYKIMEPKTAKSKRTIPLSEVVIEALKIQYNRQQSLKKKFADIYQNQDFVFARYDGQYLNQRAFMNEYKNFLKKYGIHHIRFHDLRHSFASLLLEAGESPKVIQELLGHSTITTTMDIYAHVSKKAKINTIEKLNDLINI